MKSSWFKDTRQYEFAKALQSADNGGHRMSEIFQSFLEVAFGTLRQAVHIFREQACSVEIEEAVRKEQARYRNPRAMAEAFAIMVNALEDERRDFLGTVYGCLGMNDKNFAGQCFTPESLCQLIGGMLMGEETRKPGGKRLSISEPAVGGGAMVIALAKQLQGRGFNPWNYWVDCTDRDWRCVYMAYIQLTLCGIPARVRHGDSLCPKETDKVFDTIALAMFPLRKGDVTFVEPVKPPKRECVIPKGKGIQLALDI